MRTVEDCLKDAWQALLKGDYAERDRQSDMATHIRNQQIRVKEGGPLWDDKESIVVDEAKISQKDGEN